MHIIGITGPINHGKTTVARLLASAEPKSKHIESWQIIADVAQKLNQSFDSSIVNANDLPSVNSWLYHLLEILPATIGTRPTFDQIEITEHEIHANEARFNKLFVYIDRLKDNPGLAREEIEESNKEDHRPILQFLGGYLPSCLDDSLWFDAIIKKVLENADGLELYTIAGARYQADAACIRRHGGKVIEISRQDYTEMDITDPTEASRKQIEPDSFIKNNGNLQDLEKVVDALWSDLKNDRLRIEYSAVN